MSMNGKKRFLNINIDRMSYNESFRKLMVYPVPVVGNFDSLNVAPLDDSMLSPPPVLTISQPLITSAGDEFTISSSAILSLAGIKENIQSQLDVHNVSLNDMTEKFQTTKYNLDSVIDGNNCSFANSNITNVYADTITSRVGNIDNIMCLTASVTNIYGNASLKNVVISTASMTDVSATNASFKNIHSTLQISANASFDNASITTASLVKVTAMNASLSTLQSDLVLSRNASFNSVSLNTASMLHIYSDKAEMINANFGYLFSNNADFGGIHVGMINNIPFNTFGYISNVTSDIQSQIEQLKVLADVSQGNYDLSLNTYFASVKDVSLVNACLYNLSSNYWLSAAHIKSVMNGSSASFVNACISNISSANASFFNMFANNASLDTVSCKNASCVLLYSKNSSFSNVSIQNASVVQLSASNACLID